MGFTVGFRVGAREAAAAVNFSCFAAWVVIDSSVLIILNVAVLPVEAVAVTFAFDVTFAVVVALVLMKVN